MTLLAKLRSGLWQPISYLCQQEVYNCAKTRGRDSQPPRGNGATSEGSIQERGVLTGSILQMICAGKMGGLSDAPHSRKTAKHSTRQRKEECEEAVKSGGSY